MPALKRLRQRAKYVFSNPQWSLALFIGIGLCLIPNHGTAALNIQVFKPKSQIIQELNAREDALGKLAPAIKILEHGFENMHVFGQAFLPWLAMHPQIDALQILPGLPWAPQDGCQGPAALWPIKNATQNEKSKTKRTSLAPFHPFLKFVHRWQDVHLHAKKIQDISSNRIRIEAHLQGVAILDPIAKSSKYTRALVDSDIYLEWIRASSEPLHSSVHTQEAQDTRPPWLIARLQIQSFSSRLAAKPRFRPALATMVPDLKTQKQLQSSHYEDMIVDVFVGKNVPTPKLLAATEDHGALALVDLNHDGWDSLYVARRMAPNILLVRQKDGTYRDEAAERGLNIAKHSNAVAFVDLDHDGDNDLLLGRSYAPSLYFQNNNGKFSRAPLRRDGRPLPSYVSSIAVADVDGDGLIDIYWATSAAQSLRQASILGDLDFLKPLDLSPWELRELKRRLKSSQGYIDSVGLPNRLMLQGEDGLFAPSKTSHQVEGWRHSMAASWEDIDGDGRLDLYVANDFAQNDLYLQRRSQSHDGAPQFVRVHQSTQAASTGFGMGIDWHDMDGDGHDDLYISNMWSNAGQRITQALHSTDLDPRFAQSASGNKILLNRMHLLQAGSSQALRTPRLLDASDQKPYKTLVAAGWSWGGQFVDLNNSGRMDVFVPNGNYTAPRQIESVGDT